MSARALEMRNLSGRRRFGCKGPAAESWLAAQGFGVAPGVNRWSIDSRGVLVARLTTSEFLVESTGEDARAVEAARSSLFDMQRGPGVYPVDRQDFALELAGPALEDFLLQTCSIHFAPLLRAATADAGEVLLTSMIGVAVVAIVRAQGEAPRVTTWIDPSYAHYFESTLLEVAGDLGQPHSLQRAG